MALCYADHHRHVHFQYDFLRLQHREGVAFCLTLLDIALFYFYLTFAYPRSTTFCSTDEDSKGNYVRLLQTRF